MRSLHKRLLLALALVVVLSSDAAAKVSAAGGEGGIDDGVVVPAADCSVTVIGQGQACTPQDCETDCRKQHNGMGACAAIGCSCAVCAKYPPAISSQQGN